MVVFWVVVQWLFETLVGLSPAQQRQFLCFATGSPRLPIGGTLTTTPPPLTRAVDGFVLSKWFWLSKWFAEAWVCVSRVECFDAGADDSSAGNRRRWGQPGPLPTIRPHPAPLALLVLLVLAVLFVLGKCLGQCKLRKGRLWMMCR